MAETRCCWLFCVRVKRVHKKVCVFFPSPPHFFSVRLCGDSHGVRADAFRWPAHTAASAWPSRGRSASSAASTPPRRATPPTVRPRSPSAACRACARLRSAGGSTRRTSGAWRARSRRSTARRRRARGTSSATPSASKSWKVRARSGHSEGGSVQGGAGGGGVSAARAEPSPSPSPAAPPLAPPPPPPARHVRAH